MITLQHGGHASDKTVVVLSERAQSALSQLPTVGLISQARDLKLRPNFLFRIQPGAQSLFVEGERRKRPVEVNQGVGMQDRMKSVILSAAWNFSLRSFARICEISRS